MDLIIKEPILASLVCFDTLIYCQIDLFYNKCIKPDADLLLARLCNVFFSSLTWLVTEQFLSPPPISTTSVMCVSLSVCGIGLQTIRAVLTVNN